MCKIADWVVLILLFVVAVHDWRRKQIPLLLLIGMSAVIAIFVFVCRAEHFGARMGGVAVGILFFIISKCTKEAIGYGDSWLILLLGAYVGGLRVLVLLFVASLLSAICSLFYLWKRRWQRSATIPFAPFLAFAYLGEMML